MELHTGLLQSNKCLERVIKVHDPETVKNFPKKLGLLSLGEGILEEPWGLMLWGGSVQLLSRVQLCDPMDCSMPSPLSITNS